MAQVTYQELETAGGFNDTFATAEDCRQIGNNFTIQGMVHQGNSNSDDEWYKFDGNAGATLTIDFNITMPVSTSPSALYQLNVWLYDSSQTMIAAWNTATAQSSANFGIGVYTLPATDTYYIYVTEWSVAPNALSQPGLTFTPLSTYGYGVTGATPDSTRNTAGGNQTFGSLYDINVSVSSGNGAQFDVQIACDPTTGAITCFPNPARVCWVPGGAPNVQFLASGTCPSAGLSVSIAGGGSGSISPGGNLTLFAPGPGLASTITVDDGTGPQVCGVVETVRTLVTQGGFPVFQVSAPAGTSTCLDVCAPLGSLYLAVLSEGLGPAIPFPPFLPPLEIDLNGFLFALSFPVNQLSPIVTGLQGVAGTNQICLNLPPGSITSSFTIYLQVVSYTGAGTTGLSSKVDLTLTP
jgi:hypothetical protein